jgi:hypothetical protein
MSKFPEQLDFLRHIEKFNADCVEATEKFTESASAGEKLPATAQNLGNLLSVIYRLGCCFWGCKGGDHQIEWLAGRISNQSLAAIRLIKSGYYDEALMLIRGVGEIANLLQLFVSSSQELSNWKQSTKKERISKFGPAAVRKKLELVGSKLAIEQDRYQRLCEVGTHPVPGQAPGHYTGTGRPILGGFVQHVGVFVCYTELSYAVSLCGTALIGLLDIEKEIKQKLFDESVKLLRSLGGVNITNYEELLAKAKEDNTKNA